MSKSRLDRVATWIMVGVAATLAVMVARKEFRLEARAQVGGAPTQLESPELWEEMQTLGRRVSAASPHRRTQLSFSWTSNARDAGHFTAFSQAWIRLSRAPSKSVLSTFL